MRGAAKDGWHGCIDYPLLSGISKSGLRDLSIEYEHNAFVVKSFRFRLVAESIRNARVHAL